MNAKRIWVTIGALAVLTGGWLWTSREPEPSKGIRALQADPLASYVPKGTLRTQRGDYDQNTSLGKTSPVAVIRWHVMREQDASAAWRELRTVARKGGWRDSPFGLQRSPTDTNDVSQRVERKLRTGQDAYGYIAIGRKVGASPVPSRQLVVSVSLTTPGDSPE